MDKNTWKIIFIGLLLISSLFIIAVFQVNKDNDFHLVACNVGQGDGFLIYQGNMQIIVDGGPGQAILSCLSEHIPFWDRKIELVILSHPQEDHYGGLIEVARRYKIEKFVHSGLDSSNQSFKVLESAVGGDSTKVIGLERSLKMRSGMLYLDIFYPTADFIADNSTGSDGGVLGRFTSARDPNDFSVIFELSYGQFKALFTGDIGPAATPELISTDKLEDVDYLKIPHHGSKNGLNKELLDKVTPEIAVISVGKNPWGHPHEEVLNMLKDKGVGVYRTDEMGDVEVVTDGVNWRVE